MRIFLNILLFLALVAEVKAENIYAGKWSTFMGPISEALMTPLPIKAPLFDLLVVGVLVVASAQRAALRGRAKPLVRALWTSLASIGALVTWGLLRGGSVQQVLWQLHPFIVLVLLAFAIMAVCRTPRDFAALGKTFLLAALYRALMVALFYWLVVKGEKLEPPPATMTTHGDTVLFVTAIVVIVINALERLTLRSIVVAVVVGTFVLYAIYLNNRRLAYVSLIGALVVVYAMFKKGKVKRRFNALLLAALPLVAIYIAVGWGSTSPVFKPVGALSTMFGKHEDASSETRNIENYNLIQTLKENPLIGTGWGHQYKEVSVAYSIVEAFAQYRYIPHNSVLGLLAFSGVLGFVGTWLVFPVGAYFAARTYRVARTPLERVAALAALAEVVVYTNQMYGDMGFTSSTGGIMMATSLAISGRLSVTTGAWPSAPKQSRDSRIHEQANEGVEGTKNRRPDDGPAQSPLRLRIAGRDDGNDDRRDQDREKK